MKELLAFLTNPIVLPSALAWAIASILKVLLPKIFRGSTENWSRVFNLGGMPSAHSCYVVSLAVSVGLWEGFGSTVFVVALGFAFVVMGDAMGFRESISEHARTLNYLLEEEHKDHGREGSPKRLWDKLGHKPIEVIAGAALGFVIAIVSRTVWMM